jgi:hypothetical protein
MRKKKLLPGYIEAQEELQVAILYGGCEARVLMRNLRDMKRQLRLCNFVGSASYIDHNLAEYLRKDMALNLQRLIRHANAARQAVVAFLEANKID